MTTIAVVPVQMEAVLALLPEIFPGVQEIPLKNIHFDPENPGTPITDEQIQDLADDMAQRGQQNPIQVCPYKASLLVPGVALHPDNPRLKADGTPWKVADFNWMTLAGEGRSRAAMSLRWETLKGFIGNPTPEEAVKITYWDNKIRYRGDWWPDYQTIERLIKANPSLTQRQVAVVLKMDLEKVNRALRLLPLLNPEARGLIVRNTNNSNKGIRGISEIAASRLADLGPGTGLKRGVRKEGEDSQKLWPYPAILPETQDLVLQALKAAVDDQMTEAQVRQMVKSRLEPSPQAGEAGSAVPGGSPNATLGVSPAVRPQASVSKLQVETHDLNVSNPQKGFDAERQALVVPTGEKPVGAASPRLNDVLSSVAGSLLTKKAKQAHNQGLNRIVPRFSKIFGLATKLVEWLGVKHKVWATVIAFFLVMFLGSFVISNVKSFLLRHLHLPYGPQVIGQALVVPGQGTELTTSQTGPGIPVTVYQTAPQAATIDASPDKRLAKRGKVGVVPKKAVLSVSASPRLNAVKPLAEGGTIPAWTQADIPLASEFAGKFFGVSYSNWADNLAYLKAHVVEDYGPTLVQQYFPDSMQKEFVANQLVQYFSPSQPARVVSGEGNSAQLRVEGKVITQTLRGRMPQTLYEKPVALLMDYRKVEGFGSRIEKVSVVDPGTQTAQGEDVGKSIGDGVKDYSNAVNTVDDGLSATDKAKKLLGF